MRPPADNWHDDAIFMLIWWGLVFIVALIYDRRQKRKERNRRIR